MNKEWVEDVAVTVGSPFVTEVRSESKDLVLYPIIILYS
jgi:hypothetical protein